MFSELDETIRAVLTKEGGFDPAEIDVSFEIPNREWSAGISRPTLNCYLFDIRENRELLQTGMQDLPSRSDRPTMRRRPPLRMDLTYLITAWTRQVEDEHRLLWHAFSTLFRFSIIPEAHLQGVLREQTLPIYASIAQADTVLKSPGDFWTALENQIKPSLSYVVTLAIERELLMAGQPIASRELRILRSGRDDEARDRGVIRDNAAVVATAYQIRGVVRNPAGAPISGVQVALLGSARDGSITDSAGQFTLRNVPPGPLTIVATRDERELARLETEVPGKTYDIILS
jgi:Pvc16 N-terminal domain/Carboxypeptidase regulatory-like domain